MNRNTKRSAALFAAVVALLAGMGMLMTSGAYLNDSALTRVTATTQHVDITLTPKIASNTCYVMGAINPGHSKAITCTVTNAGTATICVSVIRREIKVERAGVSIVSELTTTQKKYMSVKTVANRSGTTKQKLGHAGDSEYVLVSDGVWTLTSGATITIQVTTALDKDAANEYADTTTTSVIYVYARNV